MNLHKIALLILLAACARPAYSGSASAGEATSASASSLAPAATPGINQPLGSVSAPTTATTRSSTGQSLPRLSGATGAARQAAAPVLVIPAKEMAPETYDRIVEDLSVMNRILEKSVTDAPELYEYDALRREAGALQMLQLNGYVSSRQRGDRWPWILRASSGRPKPLYIGGYGVVFSLQVDFPLVPPPEAPEPNKSADKTDRVWAAAQRELVNPQPTIHLRPGVLQGAPYRAEAVENLRSTLIALLKHATNIRDLEPESWLTILVQGPSGVADQGQDSSGDQQASLIGARPSGRTLLTLRAKKADIDQLAKGSLEQTEFQKRVQITAY
jgi:hypothetical protein